jgi:hypothetical protein
MATSEIHNSYVFMLLLPQNVKAYLRRGAAKERVLNHQEALQGVAIFWHVVSRY